MQRIPKQPIDNPDYVHPRTLEQAFGEGGPVEEKDAQPPMDWSDKIILWLAPVVAIFIIVLLALEN